MLLQRKIKEEIIDYKKIVALPYLEIKEGLHIFSGFKSFDSYFEIISDDIKKYLHREKIWWIFPWWGESRFNILSKPSDLVKRYLQKEQVKYILTSNETKEKRVFRKYYVKLLEKNDYILSQGVELSCYQIKTIVPIYTSIFPPLSLHERILYLWKTEHLLYWALGEGLVLPKELQNAFNIDQFDYKNSQDLEFIIYHPSIQGLAQIIWYLFPNEDSYESLRKKMKEILSNDLNNKKIWTPLDHLLINTDKYFKDEKTNALDQIFKKIDPRINKRKGRPSLINSLPIKINSEILKEDKINFEKFKYFILTVGAILFRLKKIDNVESALEHPVIYAYLKNQNFRIKDFAKYWLLTILPSKEMNIIEKDCISIPYHSEVLQRRKAASFLGSIKGKSFQK